MNIYEMHGRQSEQLQEALEAFRKTLQLMRELQAGTLTLDQVRVSEQSWEIVESPNAR